MSTQNKQVKEKITDSFELPKDVVLGFPLISICGNRTCDIDNHQGILSYEAGQIIVRTKLFPIRVNGKELQIECYSKDSIRITGQITEICFKL
jgi:sporulation protein YqfC